MTQQQDDPNLTHMREDTAEFEGKAVSLTDEAIAHFKLVLRSEDATDTAKTNAANGLAQIDRQRAKGLEGTIHRLTRSELTQEISRMQALLAHL
jgi:hypothetical protein